MTRAAVLIPTSAGPIEGIIHEPDGPPVAAAVTLPGAMSRSETNRKWARLGDVLARMGILVLRFEYYQLAEEKGLEDEAVERAAFDAIDWYSARTGGLELLLCGLCHGARVCTKYAASNRVAGLALVTPLFRRRAMATDRLTVHAAQLVSRVAARLGGRLPSPRTSMIDREMADSIGAAASAVRPWILLGERDYQWRGWADAGTRPEPLRAAAVEVVRGVQLHSSRTLAAQDAAVDRTAAWAGRVLGRE